MVLHLQREHLDEIMEINGNNIIYHYAGSITPEAKGSVSGKVYNGHTYITKTWKAEDINKAISNYKLAGFVEETN